MPSLQPKKKRMSLEAKTIQSTTSKPKPRGKAQKSPQYTNVNSYKHFLQVPSTNQDYIHWAFGLRDYQKVKNISTLNSSSSVPNVYYKTIEAEKEKHSTTQLDNVINFGQFSHLGLRRIGNFHPSAGLLQFETSLRSQGQVSQELKKKEKDWRNYAIKDRGEQPKLIQSKSLKKKYLNSEQTESAVDGRHRYPKFTEKVIAVRNYQQFRHMLKGEVHLPTIGWQTGLRNY